MHRNWISLCMSVAGLATLIVPADAEACGRRRQQSACCNSYVAAPASTGCCGASAAPSGCCGTAHVGHHHHYASAPVSGCSSCGGTAAVYSPGVYATTGNWSGGACTNCGPNTTVVGMTNGNNVIQQANYTPTNGGGSIVLTVPENAEVMWGGQAVQGTGTTRRFVTLPIQGNNGAQQFQVRWMGQNGQWVTRNQTINATANQQVTYDFTNPNAAASGQAGGQFGTEEAQPNPNSQNKQGSGTDLNPATPRKLPAPTPSNQNNNPNPGTSINPQPGTTQPSTRPNNDTPRD